jgi:hypothetical protein
MYLLRAYVLCVLHASRRVVHPFMRMPLRTSGCRTYLRFETYSSVCSFVCMRVCVCVCVCDICDICLYVFLFCFFVCMHVFLRVYGCMFLHVCIWMYISVCMCA